MAFLTGCLVGDLDNPIGRVYQMGGLCGDGGVVDCALSSMIIPIPNYEECYREDIIVCKCCQWGDANL